MAGETISNALIALSLDENVRLPFRPAGDRIWLCQIFDNIPRYLFRVATPKSDCSTTTPKNPLANCGGLSTRLSVGDPPLT